MVADSRFLADDGGGRMPENLTFALNSVDYLAGDSDLIALRSREITTRPLNTDAQDVGVKSFWKKLNYFLPALLILLLEKYKSLNCESNWIPFNASSVLLCLLCILMYAAEGTNYKLNVIVFCVFGAILVGEIVA